ncbi:OrdA protein [Cylindrobasidium torrendii FP15055 ss-10]|uniref:OrdA protein n=1 Tax=Cylindrobasidium torrendii FP15055 ss-10 TaxID=1314674 RepID=A0A0D7BMW6_9AGAR|nr:OrdA protein [Cylindrobasidium torrendii FP15055 ss-10]
MSTSTTVVVLGLTSVVLYYGLRRTRSEPAQSAPYPPGPKGLPIIGNVLDMPKNGQDWLTYAVWGREYKSGIVGVKLLGQPIVIINDGDILSEFDRVSHLYSDRPPMQMAGNLVGYAKTLVLMPYSPTFRSFRKHFARIMGSPAQLKQYLPMAEQKAKAFVRRMLAHPTELEPQLRTLAGSIILNIAYGITVEERDDRFVTMIERILAEGFNNAAVAGKFLVDVMPALKFVPEWLPGAGFQTLARKWRNDFNDMVNVPYQFATQLIADGVAPVSFVSTSLELDDSTAEIENIKHCAASMYGAGADTTVSTEHAFFLAMLLNQDVQKTAQAEIDSVTGGERLPTYADREHLPYVHALVTELLRWHNVAPLGVPHRAMEDGVVHGHFIPKGSIIVANLWQMLHNPEVYPDPLVFDPTRFIASPGKEVQRDPRHACFGFGRRICPGMHLAEASVYAVVAMSLAVFDILPVMKDGKPIIPQHSNTDGTISHQPHFPYVLRARSEKAVTVVQRETADL